MILQTGIDMCRSSHLLPLVLVVQVVTMHVGRSEHRNLSLCAHSDAFILRLLHSHRKDIQSHAWRGKLGNEECSCCTQRHAIHGHDKALYVSKAALHELEHSDRQHNHTMQQLRTDSKERHFKEGIGAQQCGQQLWDILQFEQTLQKFHGLFHCTDQQPVEAVANIAFQHTKQCPAIGTIIYK